LQATQTFYVPLPEEDLFQNTFEKIHAKDAEQPVNTMISVVISTDDTVVFYDHWEDGYDAKPTDPDRESTRVWGDGDAGNGCAPVARLAGRTCTDADDVLRAGDSFILESTIPASKERSKDSATGFLEPLFDGGDRISATLPVAVTRGAFPDQPGSLMAGAVEVLDTDSWGTDFISPVGPNRDTYTDAFEYTVIYVMASEDGTVVTHNGGDARTLNRGQSYQYWCDQGDTIEATKPVQADLLTGDIGSTYELRWFSLLDVKDWSNEYLSPVGDSVGKTKVYLYNPSSTNKVDVTYDRIDDKNEKVTLDKQQGQLSDVIPTGSAAHFKGNGKFLALSLTDFETSKRGWHGQIYDWGFPVMPLEHLTEQVVVGLGFGCTHNECKEGKSERSVVWVAALEDCWVHVDFNNDGVDDLVVEQRALESRSYTDTVFKDEDMSGALIYATKQRSVDSSPVSIAAAWGQDAARSGSGDSSALDLGTVVLPFTSVRVKKFMNLYQDVDKNQAYSKGDVVEFVIEVVNVGQVDVEPNTVTIVDDEHVNWQYVEDSFVYQAGDRDTVIDVPDDTASGSTPFPLDEGGLKNQAKIRKRGGTNTLRYLAVINYDGGDGASSDQKIRNAGYLTQPLRPPLPFEVEEPLVEPLVWPRTSGGSCMYDNWKDHGKTQKLSCTAKEVWIDEAFSTEPKSCEVGKPIKLTLNARVHFNGDTFDPGWYIATDGGDAMTGTCALAALEEAYGGSIRLTKSESSNILADDAKVQWTGDVGNDECGDVTNVPGGGAVLDYQIAVATDLICGDSDKDGRMDFNICFSWRKPDEDEYCAFRQALSEGHAPDLYPGSDNSCFCSSVSIPNVIALDPGDKVFPLC